MKKIISFIIILVSCLEIFVCICIFCVFVESFVKKSAVIIMLIGLLFVRSVIIIVV